MICKIKNQHILMRRYEIESPLFLLLLLLLLILTPFVLLFTESSIETMIVARGERQRSATPGLDGRPVQFFSGAPLFISLAVCVRR